MEKPELIYDARGRVFYNYLEVLDYVGAFLGCSVYDYLGQNDHFRNWFDKLVKTTPAIARSHRSHTKQWDLYTKHPEGFAIRPPLLSFYRWLIAKYPETYNADGSMVQVKEDLAQLSPEEEWLRPILLCLQQEFGDSFYIGEVK